MADFLQDYLEHSWGTNPEQKRRESQYNHEYYLKNKEKWEKRAESVHPEHWANKIHVKNTINSMSQKGMDKNRFDKIKGGLQKVAEGHTPTTVGEENNLTKRGYVYYKGDWYQPKNQATREAVLEIYRSDRAKSQKKIAKSNAANEASKQKQSYEKMSDVQSKIANKYAKETEERAYAVAIERSSREGRNALKKKRELEANVKGRKEKLQKRQEYLNEIRDSKDTRSGAKKVRDLIDGTVEYALDSAKSLFTSNSDSTSVGKQFLKDFFGGG